MNHGNRHLLRMYPKIQSNEEAEAKKKQPL